MHKNYKKSQSATEYLVVLAVVIIIALIVVNVLGGIPGIGSRIKNLNESVIEEKFGKYTENQPGDSTPPGDINPPPPQPDTTPPVWNPTPTNQVVQVGSAFSYDVSATDASTVTYSISDTTNFKINSATGLIENNIPLTNPAAYSLTITAKDTSNNAVTATITITVQSAAPPPPPPDTTPPAWSPVPTDKTVNVNAAFSYDVSATDATTVTYSISDVVNFKINSATGLIENNIPLTTPTTYPLTITAKDTSNNAITATITITVQSAAPLPDTTPPVWNPTPTNQVVQVGSALSYDVSATDTSAITYSISDTTNFKINSATGLIENNIPLATPAAYSLTITAKDTSNNAVTATITVTVQSTTLPPYLRDYLVLELNLDEGAGTTAEDTSGRNTDGALNGGKWGTNCLSGSCVVFDGTGNYYIRVNNIDISGSKEMTFMYWVNYLGFGAYDQSGYSKSGYGIKLGSAYSDRLMFSPGLAVTNTRPYAFNTGRWYHLALASKIGEGWGVYVNGAEVSRGAGDLPSSSFNLIPAFGIGAVVEDVHIEDFFPGTVDEIKLFSKSLTADEISQIFNTFKDKANPTQPPPTPITDGLKIELDLDEAFGTTAKDSSGNNNDGTIYGTPSWSVNCISGTCLNFNGPYVSIPSAPMSLNSGTVSFWVKPNYNSGAGVRQGIWYLGSGSGRARIIDYEGKIYLQNGAQQVSMGSGINIGSWTFITITWEGTGTAGTTKIYKNGVLAGSSSAGGLAFGIPVSQYFGSEIQDGWKFNGAGDEFKAYDRVLSAAEIQQLYECRC